ncbi:MAG: DsrE family protein [Candidatus Diapherotrites archaeon]|uniref:DsrE family protein n=1 Tax=Candidatus Iainarchaeum sp. TaxID=3101447 RepID=A0A938YT24_9ARCH|nr:DsrE family protein [Candidatus Diapherotrites archaeon]
MKIGIILCTKEPEKAFNAFRFANFALQKRKVNFFLFGEGVEVNEIEDKEFNVKEELMKFMQNKGTLFSCGSCMKLREKEESKTCPISTMSDLMKLVEGSDKIVSFG